MSESFEVTLPKLGESIVGATVVQWLKKVGDPIKLDDALLEVSTDKVNSEIPSPVEGVLEAILVQEDEEIEIGTPLARISVKQIAKTAVEETVRTQEAPASGHTENEDILSPAVIRLAKTEGISLDMLRKIEGTGGGGRITKKDVQRYASSEKPAVPQEDEERVEMDKMRKAIADNMVRSFYEAPHASLVAEADVTEIMSTIKREKARFFETHGVKLTVTSFLIQALAKAVEQFPMLNSSLDNETIVMKRNVNVGIAVNIEKGLMVPVIEHCQERNLVSIAKAVADLSAKARANRLAPDEVKEGTITLTNFGMTGALIGVPIIRYPEVAIIGAGTIQKRPTVRDDDSIAVRQMMYLTLTFDHRVIDGIYGCQFLAAFKQQLESISIH